jgi:hypothetical protein
MNKLVITEYGEPSLQMVWAAEQLKALPAPEHCIGDIVIVPPCDYGLVSLICPDKRHSPPQGWVYGVTCAEDWERIYYFPAESVVKRG